MRLLLRASGEGPGFDGEQFAFVDLTPAYVRDLLRWREQFLALLAKNAAVTALQFRGDGVRFYSRSILHTPALEAYSACIDGGPCDYTVVPHAMKTEPTIDVNHTACFVGQHHVWWFGVRVDGNVVMDTVALPWTFLHLPEAVAERTAEP
jgi:hypothetical protein